MKKNLILGSLIAFASIGQSQNTVPNGSGSGNVGIGTTSPGLELDVVTASSSGGIRLTQTTYGSAAFYLRNNTSGGKNWGFLSLGQGDTPDPGDFGIWDMSAGNRLFISGGGGNTPAGFVGIGTTIPQAKLHASGTTVGARGDANASTCTGVAGNGTGISSASGGAVGIAGRATGAQVNTGGYFVSTGGSSGVASYGVVAEIYYPNNGGVNYGIYSTVGGNSGGSSYNTLAMAGYFNGDVVTTSSQYYTSDKRMKKDIINIDNSLSIINKLRPVTYNFDTKSNPYMALPVEKQYGFISQEIKEILPELTKTVIHPAKIGEDGKEVSPQKEFLGLNYNGFIAILTKGIQEQQKQIDEQKLLIANLNDRLNAKTAGVTGINEIKVADGFAMDQNVPNPFTHETVVKYTLPSTTSNAFLAVYDLTGKQLTSFPILDLGSSAITLTSEKLAAGIYIYSIVADGKIVDSKRMIVSEK
ncbi:MAG: tail fiber domain-containing protein [Bacteroidota bacterium]